VSPEVSGIIIGVASTAGAGALAFLVSTLARLWHTPKRLDRLERVVPVIIRSLLAILRCQKAGVCNGETDEAISEIENLLSEGIVSQKAKS
jgi:hypothetical protein